MANFYHEREFRHSICSKCNSKSYCQNASSGVAGCENFNKFPKPDRDETKSHNH